MTTREVDISPLGVLVDDESLRTWINKRSVVSFIMNFNRVIPKRINSVSRRTRVSVMDEIHRDLGTANFTKDRGSSTSYL